MSGIAAESLLKPTTEADVLGLWTGPAFESHPERRHVYEGMRQQVRDLAATMRPGDDLRWYDQGGWTGLAVVRSGMVVGHVPLHETIIPHCYYELIVQFAGPRATAKELMALRKLDPTLRDTPLPSVVSLVGDAPTWNLGRFYEYNVEDAERQCRELGLKTERI
ncbi:hypothetical protein [Humisphaera borealis]|uniref:Uncharacterized protein n=1 Tax=Humisphaera borealis TaxID=2807512 RepID=A0A7M2WXK8_9BACT|nr:hypothetical protein [Humisphaera borealis]QOV90216.1 hypothetical protein IPV69_02250 [Humisphaera borealis]